MADRRDREAAEGLNFQMWGNYKENMKPNTPNSRAAKFEDLAEKIPTPEQATEDSLEVLKVEALPYLEKIIRELSKKFANTTGEIRIFLDHMGPSHGVQKVLREALDKKGWSVKFEDEDCDHTDPREAPTSWAVLTRKR